MNTNPQETAQKFKPDERESEDASGSYIYGPAAPQKGTLEGEDSYNLANLKMFRRIQLVGTPDTPNTPDTSAISDILDISYTPDTPITRRRSHVLPDTLICTVVGCPAQFHGEYRQSNLARHSRLRHTSGGKVYPCEDCDKIFRRQDARLKHYRRKHPNLTTLPLSQTKKQSEVYQMNKQSKDYQYLDLAIKTTDYF